MSNTSNNSYIATGTIIKGKVTATDDMRIDGTLIGDIDAKGKLIVGQEGKIEGELKSKNTEVSGTLDVKSIDTDSLILSATARFTGDINTDDLQIESGAIIDGNISMKGKSYTSIPAP